MATFNEDVIARGTGGGGMFGGDSSGIIMGLLLGRLGLFGNQNDGGCVTNETINQQTLGDIKAAIPYNEAQMQLALAGAQATLSGQANANTQYLSQQTQALAIAQMQLAAGLSGEITAVDTNVDRQSTAIQQAVYADGERTRQLITANQIADLQQRLTVAQLENSENRSIIREQNNSHNMTVTVNQAQAQQQQQLQYLQWQLAALNGGVGQIARATNSSVVVGSTGVGTQQTANPTNVAA